MNKEKLGELVREARMHQARGEALKEQLVMFQENLNQLEATIETLKGLGEGKKDSLIPAGSGVYLKGKEIEGDVVLVNVGAGIIIEKSVPEALEIIDKRKSATEEMMEKVEGEMYSLSKELERVDMLARKLMRGGE